MPLRPSLWIRSWLPISYISLAMNTTGYPIRTMGSHVSAVPNHQTGRTTPLNTRGIVAMSGSAALLNIVVIAPKANPYPIHVHLKGLQSEAMYRETESGKVYSGAALMYGRYTLPILLGDYPGFQCRFERI